MDRLGIFTRSFVCPHMGASVDTSQNRAYRRDCDACHGWGTGGTHCRYQSSRRISIRRSEDDIAAATISADNFYCCPKRPRKSRGRKPCKPQSYRQHLVCTDDYTEWDGGSDLSPGEPRARIPKAGIGRKLSWRNRNPGWSKALFLQPLCNGLCDTSRSGPKLSKHLRPFMRGSCLSTELREGSTNNSRGGDRVSSQ